MRLRIVSDIHSEFWDFSPSNEGKIKRIMDRILPPLEHDKETTLVMAGDLGSMHKPHMLYACIKELAGRFRTVQYICGNHEFYGGSLRETPVEIAGMCADFPNVNFGNGQLAGIAGPNIWKCTLWTDYDGENPRSMAIAHMHMNDYRHIAGWRDPKMPTFPDEVLEIHKKHRGILEKGLEQGDIVITHHLPSPSSIDAAYIGSAVNGAYCSNLEHLIRTRKPRLWIHGHTHVAKDYKIGDTRVVCNPYGYADQHVTNGYNPTLVVELENYVV